MHNPGVSRREIAQSSLVVIARSKATKQSILPSRGKMDCFASLAMTMLSWLFEKLNQPYRACTRRGMRPGLVRGLHPFRRTPPQRVAMLGAEKSEMADLARSRIRRRNRQDFRLDRG